MTNLIDAGMEDLIQEDGEYRNISFQLHGIKDDLVTSLTQLKTLNQSSNKTFSALVQALIESEVINAQEKDFGTKELMNRIYAAKMHQSLSSALSLHQSLMDNGFTKHDHNNAFNSSGDNYYSAMTFTLKSGDSALKFTPKEYANDVKRHVIIMEGQSPMYAAIIQESAFSKKPETFLLVKLRHDYDHDDHMDELIERQFDIDSDHNWSPYNDGRPEGIIARLDIASIETKDRIVEPASLESALFRVYSGNDSLNEVLEIQKKVKHTSIHMP